MKLVDILARELKVWPDDCTDVVGQAVDGTLHLNSANSTNRGWTELTFTKASDWYGAEVTRAEWQGAVDALNAPPEDGYAVCRCECGTVYQWPASPSCPECNLGEFTLGDLIACGYLTPYMSLHHQWVGRAYRFETKPEWSEDGLPNVGTKCVIYKGTHGLAAGAEEFIGPIVTVTARFKSARGIEMACVDRGDDGGCHVFRADMCFHLPTAEEIAAEEREKAAIKLFYAVMDHPASNWDHLQNDRKDHYLSLVDAGWQQVTK